MLVVFVCYPALASNEYHDLTINNLALGWGGEGVYVWVEESFTNTEGCNGNVFKFNAETVLFDQNYAMLLSAFHTNHKVSLYVDGCDGNNLKLKAVRLRKN